jgi:ribosomal protein S25
MSAQGPREKIIGSVDMPDINSNEVMGTLSGMKAITAPGVATKFNLKISVAKKMLNKLEERGKIRLAARSSNLKVYEMTDSKGAR